MGGSSKKEKKPQINHGDRQQETAKEIIKKCKAFIFPFIRRSLGCMLKGSDIKNVQVQTTLMNEKTAKNGVTGTANE